MKKVTFFRTARLLAIPIILIGVVSATQANTAPSGCKLDPAKCYKLVYHPT